MRVIVLVLAFAILVPPSAAGLVPDVRLLIDGAPADRLAGLRAGLREPAGLDAAVLRHGLSSGALPSDVGRFQEDSHGWPGAASLQAMGDATGDGLGDTLLVHFPTEESDGYTLAFRALSAGGGFLWLTEFTASNIEWLTDVDLDGDGANDVLIVTLDYPGQKQPTDAPNPAALEWEWRATALRGANAELLWERVETGVALTSDLALVAAADFFSPIVGPDADGDGGADVWLNVIDRAVTSTLALRLDRFELLSGATGEPMASLPLVSTGSSAAFPIDDANGDGLADTLATVENGALTLVMVASQGAPLWVAPMTTPGIAFPIVDITGDAGGDLAYSGYDDSFTFLDGSTGATLWTIADPPFLGVLPGNVDGVAGSDVVFLDAQFDGSRNAVVARTLALRGDTGATLYDTHPFEVALPENGFTSIELRLLGGDMDGDGVEEIIFNTESGPFLERLTGDIRIVNGATGALHWSRLGTDLHGLAAGDVTGDGRADIVEWNVPLDYSSWGYGIVDGVTGSLLWSRTETVDGITGVPLGNTAGSLAGDLGLLVIGGGESWLEVRDGRTGAPLWDAP